MLRYEQNDAGMRIIRKKMGNGEELVLPENNNVEG